ncbi:MAG: hypothetical protein H7A24_17470 [Leptospiraceae bacterium]|nr:hypothetical protein [Leptospiraceae bacterium]MCP5513683.1 hypothetical protein [Leptospiraceae bacterium]
MKTFPTSLYCYLTNESGTATSNVSNISITCGTAKVYAGGYSTNSSSVLIPGYWKNGTWTALSQLDSSKSALVKCIFVSGTDVYASGYSTNSSNVQVAGYWKNGTWTSLSQIDTSKNSSGEAIFVSCGR